MKMLLKQDLNLVLKQHRKENKMKHYTTIEQSKKLVELGLNPDTADMFYSRRPTGKSDYSIFPDFKQEGRLEVFTKVDLPCWSLGALIDIMPDVIYKDAARATLRIHKDTIYHISYKNSSHLNEIWISKKTLIDAAFEMVVWLLENGYIRKGE